MRIEVWCEREMVEPFRQSRKVAEFECDVVPAEGSYVTLHEEWCSELVRRAFINLHDNSAEITVSWIDPSEFDALDTKGGGDDG